MEPWRPTVRERESLKAGRAVNFAWVDLLIACIVLNVSTIGIKKNSNPLRG